MAGKIFINYRRDDSASHALAVAQYFENKFGKSNIFIACPYGFYPHPQDVGCFQTPE